MFRTNLHQCVGIRYITQAAQRIGAVQGKVISRSENVPELFEMNRGWRFLSGAKELNHFAKNEDKSMFAAGLGAA
jgi:hypothetical protein